MKALGEADERKKEYTFIWHWQIMITSHQFVNELPLQDRPAPSNKGCRAPLMRPRILPVETVKSYGNLP